MKQKNRIKFFVLIVTMTIFPQCNAQPTNKDSNMRQKFISDIRMDGTRYYFTYNNYGLKSGVTHSPDDGTKMSKLVAVGNKLIELAKSKKDIVKIDEMFQREIEDLIDELKN